MKTFKCVAKNAKSRGKSSDVAKQKSLSKKQIKNSLLL